MPSTPVVARRRMTTPVVNTRPTPEQPPRKKQHRHSGIFRVADLGPGTMPRGKYPESPAPAGSHALISRTPTPGGMLHANLGLPRPPPRNFQPPLPQQPPKQTQQRRHNVPPVQSLRDSAAATPVGCAAWRRRFRIFLTVMFFPPGILSHARARTLKDPLISRLSAFASAFARAARRSKPRPIRESAPFRRSGRALGRRAERRFFPPGPRRARRWRESSPHAPR